MEGVAMTESASTGAEPRIESAAVDRFAALLEPPALRIMQLSFGLNPASPPEQIHQLRVAVRTLQSLLNALRPTLKKSYFAELTATADAVDKIVRTARDLDVLLERLMALDGIPEQVIDLMRSEAACERERLDAFSLPETAELVDKIWKLACSPQVRRRFVAREDIASLIESIALQSARRLQKRLRKAGSRPSSKAAHDVRIRAKRCRYVVEAVSGEATHVAKAARQLQSTLGDLNDVNLLRTWLKRADQTVGLAELDADKVKLKRRYRRQRKMFMGIVLGL